MPDPQPELRAIFCEALDRPSPREQAEYLDQVCRGRPALRARVEALLRANAEASGFLQETIDPAAVPVAEAGGRERPCTRLGPYQLLEPIGEGGMGTVWLAEQTEPVCRKVALKIIKPGMDSKQILARFEAERQALALMDHPNIAKVLDAGTTEASDAPVRAAAAARPDSDSGNDSVDPSRVDTATRTAGRPYFVMELVKGVPITTFCDQTRLTLRQRLELFVPVCQAIQHAHTKSIIHRDVKPSNVLVALYDGVPVPKVIDFGIAKAVGQRLTEQTLVTGIGQVLGTLEYMSPEQAEFNALDIDTRSDVYSLGVLLYELLTGTTPLGALRLHQEHVLEALRRIREEEPPKPSTRLAEMRNAECGMRNSEGIPHSAFRIPVQELDWIVMRALEKDRNRRYESANSLARDVERYLRDEPVEACPPSTAYRLRKFVKRHREPVLAATLLLLTLLGGVLGTTLGLVRAQQALAAETKLRDQAEKAEALAVQRLDEVTTERAVTTALNDYLRHDLLGQADIANQPFGAGLQERNPKVTVRELLDRSAATVAMRFAGQPRIEATIRLTLAETYHALGEYALARPHAERAVALCVAHQGDEHFSTLFVKIRLGSLCNDQAEYGRAEQLFQEVLQTQTAQGKPDHPYILNAKMSLGGVYMNLRKYDRAEVMCREVLDAVTDVFGADHPNTLPGKNNLALIYLRQKKYADAEPLLLEALHTNTSWMGPDHPDTLSCKGNLASAYRHMGRPEKAVPLGEGVLRSWQRTRGANHLSTIRAAYELAASYDAAGQLTDAEALIDEWLPRGRRLFGLGHRTIQSGIRTALEIYDRQKKPAKAGELLRAQADYVKEQSGAESSAYAEALHRVSANLSQQQKYADAEPFLRTELAIRGKLRSDSPVTLLTQARLGAILFAQKKYAEAEPLLVESFEGLKPHRDQAPVRAFVDKVLVTLVQLYDATGQSDKAAAYRKEQEAVKKSRP